MSYLPNYLSLNTLRLRPEKSASYSELNNYPFNYFIIVILYYA